MNLAIYLMIEEPAKQKEQILKEMIPQELIKYQSVFDKTATNIFPDRWPWDYAIQPKVHYRKSRKRLHMTIRVTIGICQKERWKIMTSTRLLITQ